MPAPLTTSFTVPTLQALITRISGDLQAQLSDLSAFAPGSDEYVLARVLAGSNFLSYSYLEAILRELFVGSASQVNLEKIGGMWGISRNQETDSNYTIEVTATDATTIPQATLCTSSDGTEFLTDADLVFAAPGTDTVNVTSVETGSATNLTAGATLNWAVALPDVDPTATVMVVIEDGVDLEDLEAYRTRIIYRIGHTPQGSAEADYVLWTTDVDGVERCWVTSPTLGEVTVVFDGSPSAPTVQAALDLVTPITASVTVIKGSGTEIALVLNVHKLSGYSDSTVLASITASLEALYARKGATSTTLHNSELRQAVSVAAGVDYFTVTDLFVDGGSGTYTALSDVTTDTTHWHAVDPDQGTAAVYITFI